MKEPENISAPDSFQPLFADAEIIGARSKRASVPWRRVTFRCSPHVSSLSRGDCRFSSCGSMMKRMSFSETIFLFLLALIIFGPKKLPEIARQVGKALNEFRRASNEFKAQIEAEVSQLEMEDHQQILPPSQPPKGAVAALPL